jgi:hypothetical protein
MVTLPFAITNLLYVGWFFLPFQYNTRAREKQDGKKEKRGAFPSLFG